MQRFIFISLILLGLLSEVILMNQWFLIPTYAPKMLYSLAAFYFIVTVAIYMETHLFAHSRYPIMTKK